MCVCVCGVLMHHNNGRAVLKPYTQDAYNTVASPGGFQGFLETSQALTIACSTVQLATYYSLVATGTELSL